MPSHVIAVGPATRPSIVATTDPVLQVRPAPSDPASRRVVFPHMSRVQRMMNKFTERAVSLFILVCYILSSHVYFMVAITVPELFSRRAALF